MSIEIESLTTTAPVKVRLGLIILSEIVPRILNDGLFIGERLSLAYTWYMFLCRVARCPADVPREMEKWGLSELRKVAEALVDYARALLGEFVSARPQEVPAM